MCHVAQKFAHKYYKRVLSTHSPKELVACGEKDNVDIIVILAERNKVLQPENYVEDVLAAASCAVLLFQQTGGAVKEKDALLRLSAFA